MPSGAVAPAHFRPLGASFEAHSPLEQEASGQRQNPRSIVVRLVGTNEDKARDLLAGTDLVMMPTMAEAAQKAVELSQLDER